MKRSLSLVGGMLAAALLFGAGTAHAHIKMLKPTSWLKDDATGGAQEKKGPCGPGGYDGLILGQTDTPSGVVTTFKAGEEITVEWEEVIDHPGYFRIALAENRADLKDPTVPFTDMGSCNVDHPKIPTGPHDNVLADGILIASSAASRPGYPHYSYKVTLPNKPCEKCTLQLIQFMESHPPDCIYYHCADIKITAGGAGGGDAGASDAGTPGAQVDAATAVHDSGIPPIGSATLGGAAGGSAAGGSTAGTPSSTGGTAAGTGTVTGGPGGGTAGGTAPTATAGGTGTTASPAGSGTPAPQAGDDDGGCSIALAGNRSPASGLVSMLLLVGLLARRKRQR